MGLGEDLRTYLTTNETLLEAFPEAPEAGRIQQNKIDQGTAYPRVWYGRAGTEQDLFYGSSTGLTITRFDLEVSSIDIDEAFSLTDVIKGCLSGYSGELGESQVLLIEVEDHDDTYYPQSNVDEGLFISSISVSIYT